MQCCTICPISIRRLHCFWLDIHEFDILFPHVQATSLLSEIFPGSSPKVGATYWDQVQELAMISVIKRILQRLHDILDLVSFYLLITNHWIFDLLLDFSPCLVLSIVPLKKKQLHFNTLAYIVILRASHFFTYLLA